MISEPGGAVMRLVQQGRRRGRAGANFVNFGKSYNPSSRRI
jgi:hypothetical protein